MNFFQRINRFLFPEGVNRNLQLVLIEAIFLGFLFSADPFLTVFLARLGATNVEIGLFTSMTAISGLFFAIPISSFLQKRIKLTPWYSFPRLFYSITLALTGIIPFFIHNNNYVVISILIVWAMVTFPQNILMITFTYVMNAVSGPNGRYALMASRWGILSVISAGVLATIGWFLSKLTFPINYQIVFMFLSLSGVAAFFFGNRIKLEDQKPPANTTRLSFREQVKSQIALTRANPSFLAFVSKRFVYSLGMMMTVPLFPIYYVHQVHASDYWIGIISTAQTATVVIGYFIWMQLSKKKRNHTAILLITTFAMSLYPAIISVTHRVEIITIIAGSASIFGAGVDLAFFDELMRSMPPESNITFISIAQIFQYTASVIGPILGTLLADQIGPGNAMLIGASLRFLSFALFFTSGFKRKAILQKEIIHE
jgi:hypothetical protein